MEYGICNLGNVPIRSKAKDQAEIVSFLLFGEHFKIISTKKNWIKIITHHDNYEGWICSKQYTEISYEDFDHLSINKFPICGDKNGEIINLSTGDITPISSGAILPYYHKGKFKIRKQEYSTNVNLATSNKSDLETYSKSLLNTPYLWGGRGPSGIDCSGFSQLIFRLCGIKLPRDAYQQAELGEIIKPTKSIIGDLAFFENNMGKINHVGIVLEKNKIIHSSGKVRIDELNNNGIYNSNSKSITHSLTYIKRLF